MKNKEVCTKHEQETHQNQDAHLQESGHQQKKKKKKVARRVKEVKLLLKSISPFAPAQNAAFIYRQQLTAQNPVWRKHSTNVTNSPNADGTTQAKCLHWSQWGKLETSLNKARPENKKETGSARLLLQEQVLMSDTTHSKCQYADFTYTARWNGMLRNPQEHSKCS